MVYNCAREQNNEGTPEVVLHHDLKTTTFSYMCCHLKSTEKELRKKKTPNEYINIIIIIDRSSWLTLMHTKIMTCFHFKIFLLGKK